MAIDLGQIQALRPGERLAKKLAAAPGLTLAEFRTEERRLRRDYADVLACAEASPHADLMEEVLSAARAELASARRQKRPE